MSNNVLSVLRHVTCVNTVVSHAMTSVCRRRVLLTGNESSNVDHQRLESSKRPAAAAAHKAATQLIHDPLTSITHLRTGQYYRWSPDISNISATAPCTYTDSAARSPWQHKASLYSDGDITTASHDVMSPRLSSPVSASNVT